MSEKMRDKVERLSSDLAKSVQAEIEMFDYVKTVKAEKEKLERQFLEYAKDHGVASSIEEALAFLEHYSKSKQDASEAQLKLDI
tara:strand:+ start:583 stop:834 length:252 start_codon:yes stop_codon:yes gene_type:complete